MTQEHTKKVERSIRRQGIITTTVLLLMIVYVFGAMVTLLAMEYAR